MAASEASTISRAETSRLRTAAAHSCTDRSRKSIWVSSVTETPTVPPLEL